MTAILMTISIRDPVILNHLKKQDNRSGYICRLVREDMQRDSEDLDQKIRRIVGEMMKGVRIENVSTDERMSKIKDQLTGLL